MFLTNNKNYYILYIILIPCKGNYQNFYFYLFVKLGLYILLNFSW